MRHRGGRTRRRRPYERSGLIALGASAAVLALAACGEQGPEEVAETLDKAAYECGEDGAGVIYDHTLPSTREITREQAIAQERRAGCEPKERPETEIVLICEEGDRAVVDARSPQEQDADVYVHTDDGWMLSDDEPADVCGPGAPRG